MDGDVTKMPAHELEKRIQDLEDSYAELLGDDENRKSLYLVWQRLRELKSELEKRQQD